MEVLLGAENPSGTICSRRCELGAASLPRKMEDVQKEEMNSNSNVMYVHVCYVLCRVVVMFTCILVRSNPDSRRRQVSNVNLNRHNKQQDTELQAWQQDARLQGEARMGLNLNPEQGHEGRIHEVLQEDCCSSMYSNSMQLSSCNDMHSRIVLLSPAFRDTDS